MPSSASTVLNDALTAFSQAATKALALAEDSERDELERALADERKSQRQLEDMRRERDSAIQQKHDVAMELEQCKREVDRWRAATDKAELTIKHQTDSITQARREAQQWKDQFLKIEEERCHLSARIDDLVAEQLMLHRQSMYPQEPLTPRSQHGNTDDLSASSNGQKRALSSNYQHVLPSKPETSAAPTKHVKSGTSKQRATADPPRTQKPYGKTTAERTQSAFPGASASSSQTELPHRVIRRVHAVVQIPVKDEDLEAELPRESTESHERSRSAYSEDESLHSTKVAGERRIAKRVMRPTESNRTKTYPSSDRDGAEEGEPRPRSRSIVDDDEDELMMGTEDNRNELYCSERIVVTSEVATPPRRLPPSRSPTKNPGSSNQKRKVETTDTSGSGRKIRRY